MTLTHPQRAAMHRLSLAPLGHLPIAQGTAQALARHGLVEFLHPHGNVRLTDAGRAWNDS